MTFVDGLVVVYSHYKGSRRDVATRKNYQSKKKKRNLYLYTRTERRNNETVLQRFQSDSINEFHLFVPSREKGNEEIFR